jgi:hypothetical protein
VQYAETFPSSLFAAAPLSLRVAGAASSNQDLCTICHTAVHVLDDILCDPLLDDDAVRVCLRVLSRAIAGDGGGRARATAVCC